MYEFQTQGEADVPAAASEPTKNWLWMYANELTDEERDDVNEGILNGPAAGEEGSPTPSTDGARRRKAKKAGRRKTKKAGRRKTKKAGRRKTRKN